MEGPGEEEGRNLAKCEDCGSMFPVMEDSSNEWYATGGYGCHECGSEEFRLVGPKDLDMD